MSFSDISGAYDATDNPGGWDDASTIDFDDVTNAYIIVTDASGNETLHNVFSTLDPLTPPWSENIAFPDLEIDLPDGQSSLVYYVEAGEGNLLSSQTYVFYVHCGLTCCVQEYVHTTAILYGNDPCKNADKIAYTMMIWALYQDFLSAVQGCNYNDAATMFTKLSAICNVNNTNCGC